MDGAIELDVPLDVRIGAGPSWLDAESSSRSQSGDRAVGLGFDAPPAERR
jgi:hypothetical protein